MSLSTTGVPSREQVESTLPSKERMQEGPVAIFECFEPIPCDPCYTACTFGAVEEFADINHTPSVSLETCNGCGMCVAACPGLAVFIVDTSKPGDMGIVRIPYELEPLPEKDEEVTAISRDGRALGPATVTRVQKGIKGGTPVVWLEVPKAMAMEVRHLELKRGAQSERDQHA